MMRLPGGGKPWFVGSRTARRFRIDPVSWEGWAVAIAYAALVAAVWIGIATLRPPGLHVFATLGGLLATLLAGALLIAIGLAKSNPSTMKGERSVTPDTLKEHFRPTPDHWFVPKMFGIGATPVTWQGWALTAGYIVLLVLDLTRMPQEAARIAIAVALTVAFAVLCSRKTRGGWRWRWGSDA